MDTREQLHGLAIEHGWTLTKDTSHKLEFERGEVKETMTLYFSDRGSITDVFSHRPTGDVFAVDHRPVYHHRGLTTRDKGKKEAAIKWLSAPGPYATPEINAALRKLGIPLVLPDPPEEYT